MAQPAAARKASASAAPAAQPATSTPSTRAPDDVKTQAHPPVPAPSSISKKKSPNVAATAAQPSAPSSAAPAGSTDATPSANAAESAAKSGADASSVTSALLAQEEARRLQFALAQQQVQQYQAMTKQLEAQSGIAMTPSSTIGSSTSSTSATTATATSVAGLAKTSEDLQQLRQEQLARLQQNVQRQAAMAAQAVQKRSNEDWLRNKLLLEQEHLRLLRLHELQLQQPGKGSSVTTATATSIADSLLAQKQQVVRQQQLLRDMLQKQQKQQQAQLQLQMQLQNGGDKGATTAATAATTTTTARTPGRPYATAASPSYSVKKRKLKTAFDMELEALARVCIRVANARTDFEMRQALDKLTSWLHRCTELLLLQIAQRDYRDSMAHRRPVLIQQNRWPLDLQVKSEFITQKIVQMLGAFLIRENTKAAQHEAALRAAAAASTAVATAAAATTTTTGASAIASTTPATGTPAAASSTTANTASAPATAPTVPASTPATQPTTILAPPVKRDVALIESEYAEMKAQLQAKQLEINQKAKAKRDAAKLDVSNAAGVVSSSAVTAAMLAASYKRPLQVEIPGSVKKPRTDAYGTPSATMTTGYRPTTTSVPPISPRVAQQFYDLDLSTRTSTETEDKMYLPPKIVSKIMYRALPGDHEQEAAHTGAAIRREEPAKGRTPSPAVSPAHSSQEHESSQDSISISDDAVTLMQECVTEFLLYFTSEARDLSSMQNRRTKKGVGLSISGSNVVESMGNLGFTSYARVLAGYDEKVKASQDAAARKKMERKRLVQQQAMQKAAAAAAANMAANAAKAAAMVKSAISPHPYANVGIKPAFPSPLARPGVGARPIATASTITRAAPTAKPAAASTMSAPAKSVAGVVVPSPKPPTATLSKPTVGPPATTSTKKPATGAAAAAPAMK
ncbi:hypothetical protein PHYPSEUDO_003355 [Phytophthora pseudosyringae]|uniref:Transcription factor CBF/NF-Y/archaeal histone domain-containing protein n=1 Tax=Phytophthora pseudosyringae TaxID=221518 RepID=A0A8T1VUW6_9STRA|nr:hypothetical protein PHYPSEUDO_003355 [Phytophthora pseudosyringae]